MPRRILLTGTLGGVALLLWTFVANGIFGLATRVEMNRIPAERAVYQVLRENIVVPGAYVANPEPTPGGAFPAGEPVFSIAFSGMGHEAAGRMVFADLAVAFASSLLAAGLLSMASARVLSRYARRVLFVIVTGFLLAVFGDLPKFGIGGYPAGSALLLAANHVLSWTLAGLVMGWSMRDPLEAVGATKDGGAPGVRGV